MVQEDNWLGLVSGSAAVIYQVLEGRHIQPEGEYIPGDYFYCGSDLIRIFGSIGKFREVYPHEVERRLVNLLYNRPEVEELRQRLAEVLQKELHGD